MRVEDNIGFDWNPKRGAKKKTAATSGSTQVNSDIPISVKRRRSYVQASDPMPELPSVDAKNHWSQWFQPPNHLNYYGSVSKDAPGWAQSLHYDYNRSYYQNNTYDYLVSSGSKRRKTSTTAAIVTSGSDESSLDIDDSTTSDDDMMLVDTDESRLSYEESVKRGLGLMRPYADSTSKA